MIYGIGTDIVEIERVKDAALKWGDRFLKKIFTDNELQYCYKKKNPFPHLAARFAAKESFIKALSPGNAHSAEALYEGPLSLKDIEVLNHADGKPYINPAGDLLSSSLRSRLIVIHLTMTHERSHAAATVILERNPS